VVGNEHLLQQENSKMSPKLSIFIYEPHPSCLQRCVGVIQEAGFRAIAAKTTEEATANLEDETIDALLLASSPEGIELNQYIKEFTPIRACSLSLIHHTDKDREAIVQGMNTDGFLIYPFSSSTLHSVLSVAMRLHELQRGLRETEDSNPHEQDHHHADVHLRRIASAINSRTGFYQFHSIKDLLVIEVRRAKRYAYPLSILIVGLDPLPALHELNRPSLQREIMRGLAVAIAKSIRDIDIPIHYLDDRILVFLPHTDLSGAEEVGRRIKRRIKRITYRGHGIMVQLTASVGVGGFRSGENLTFSRLIKDATAALKAAHLKGGDQVLKWRKENKENAAADPA
jgi:diguanylate cyclase (GGDEF)-like protein